MILLYFSICFFIWNFIFFIYLRTYRNIINSSTFCTSDVTALTIHIPYFSLTAPTNKNSICWPTILSQVATVTNKSIGVSRYNLNFITIFTENMPKISQKIYISGFLGFGSYLFLIPRTASLLINTIPFI